MIKGMEERTCIRRDSLPKSYFSDDGFLSGFVFCRLEPARLKDTGMGSVRFVGKALDGFVYELDGLLRIPGKTCDGLDLLKDRRGAAYGAFVDPDDPPGTFRYGLFWMIVDWYIRAYSDIRAFALSLLNLDGATPEKVELELACLGLGM